MKNNRELHKKVKYLLYSLTGITLTANKDIMIANRLDKLRRNTNFDGSMKELLDLVEDGIYKTEFINTFTTNKTHFFREEFHFKDLKDRVLKDFENKKINIYSSASSTGEEPYSIAMTIRESNINLNSSIIATDIDTNVLQQAANGIYKYDKSEKEFP